MRTRIAVISLLLSTVPAVAAPGRFDIVSYNVPDGWKAAAQSDHIQLSYREGTPRYLIVGIYRSQPASGNLEADFAREWREIVDSQLQTAGPPAPGQTQVGDGIPAMAGVAPATWAQGSLVVSLFLLDGGARVSSIVVLAADADAFKANQDRLVGFLGGVRIPRGRNAPAAGAPAPPPPPSGGKTITVADLAGDWRSSATSGTAYGYGVSVVAGKAVYHISRDGSYTYESQGYSTVGGSRSYTEAGMFSIDSEGAIVITPKGKDPKRYHFIDWKETDDDTILTLLHWEDKDLMYADHWARPRKK